MAKPNSSLWVYLTVLLAVGVGLAMTPLTRAQQTGTQQSQSDQNQKTVTATGCLQHATSGSGYQLTDSASNKTYDLKAASSDVDLSAHVGHTITVTGMPSTATASDSGSASSSSSSSTTNPPGSQAGSNPSGSMSSNQQLSVSNVKMVSSTCQGR